MKTRYRSLFLLWLVVLLFSTVARTVLFVKALPNIDLTPFVVAKIYGVGFLFDSVVFAYLAIPFILTIILIPDKIAHSKLFRALAAVVLFAITYALLFDIVAEYTFFDEFATRFNFIAIDYLIYTSEVINNIRQSYPVNWILGTLFLVNIFVFLFFRKRLDRSLTDNSTLAKRAKIGLPLLLLPLAALAFVDVSLTEISKNNYVSEVAGNGIYDLFAAFRNNELDFGKFYLHRDDKLVVGRLRGLLQEKGSRLVSHDDQGVSRAIRHPGQQKRLNVVVVVEESLSAKFLGSFGNDKGLTPNLDKLAKESLFFTHLYATGTRTVRGLEAITLSVPPLPGTSLIKRPGNEGFFSWGSVMKEQGYDNKFIYGGHGYFDNMNYFFEHNGFASIDRLNFAKDEVSFENAWGVCDEDLFRKVIREGDKSQQNGKPFFSVVMTTSNHRPFTYPQGKIDIPVKSGWDGGVKYADYSIGTLIAEAKKHPWFKDTVFVIVADHCGGSARKVALPIKNYEIPLLVYAPHHFKPQRIDRMMSQIDVAPTVLGLLNFSYTTEFMGKDILNGGDREERAFISTYQKLGFIKGDKLLVLGPKKEADFYRFDRGDGKTTEIGRNEDLLLDGLGYYQGCNYIYKNGLNRLEAHRRTQPGNLAAAR